MSPTPDEVDGHVRDALAAGDVDAAAAALEPLSDQIPEDRTLCHASLRVLRASPGRPGLVDDVGRMMASFGQDPELATLACDALIRSAERLPIDVPPPEHGAAMLAVTIAQRCLEGLTEAQRADRQVKGYLQINLANGLRLCHLYDRALAAYGAALGTIEDNGWWWFNLGLLHKVRGSFDEGLQANERALSLLGPQRPVLWNTAICATALGQGQRAVQAYAGLGIGARVADSGMPVLERLPPVQVRVASVGPGHGGPSAVPDRSVTLELLWASPLSPCHGVVQSASYRRADVDCGDLVLWDAAPADVGERDGQPVPRFPILSLLRRGDELRLRFIALERQPGAIEALRDAMPAGSQMFVHRERIERGPHAASAAGQSTPGEAPLYGKIVLPGAADLAGFRRAFDAARAAHPRVELVVPELLERLGDTPAAGKAHTMWRGIERTFEKRRQR